MFCMNLMRNESHDMGVHLPNSFKNSSDQVIFDIKVDVSSSIENVIAVATHILYHRKVFNLNLEYFLSDTCK